MQVIFVRLNCLVFIFKKNSIFIRRKRIELFNEHICVFFFSRKLTNRLFFYQNIGLVNESEYLKIVNRVRVHTFRKKYKRRNI